MKPQNRMNGKKGRGKNLSVDGDWEVERKALTKLKKDDLFAIIAEAAALADIEIESRITKKEAALTWLGEHWDIAKGIVRLWCEYKLEMEEERLAVESELKRLQEQRIQQRGEAMWGLS